MSSLWYVCIYKKTKSAFKIRLRSVPEVNQTIFVISTSDSSNGFGFDCLRFIAALNVLIWNQSRRYLNSIFCWYNRSSDKPLSEVNKLIYTSSLLEIFVLDGYLNTTKWFKIVEIGVFTVQRIRTLIWLYIVHECTYKNSVDSAYLQYPKGMWSWQVYNLWIRTGKLNDTGHGINVPLIIDHVFW